MSKRPCKSRLCCLIESSESNRTSCWVANPCWSRCILILVFVGGRRQHFDNTSTICWQNFDKLACWGSQHSKTYFGAAFVSELCRIRVNLLSKFCQSVVEPFPQRQVPKWHQRSMDWPLNYWLGDFHRGLILVLLVRRWWLDSGWIVDG